MWVQGLMLAVSHSLPAGVHGAGVGDLRVSSVGHELTPNPIYGGPLYDTIPHSLPLKPESLSDPPPLPPLTASTEPKYTDNPTTGQAKLPTSDVEESSRCRKETDDCYIQMHTRDRQ